MRNSPLYALCLQLAFAPAALAAQPTWEAKRVQMASEIKEALKSLDELDRMGPLCSDNYATSQCPSVMPPPKQTFVETAKKNLKSLEKEVAGIAPNARIADQPFDPKKLAEVDGCSGAGTSAAADATERKAAVDKMNTVFAKVSSSIYSDLGKLFDGGPGFQSKVKACVAASNLNFIEKAVVNANLPKYPHGALDYMWTPDRAHKSCTRSGVDTFRKLTGAQKGDENAQLARLAGTSKEYAANLAKSSADLAKYTKLAAKVDCSTADQTQVAAKPGDGQTPGISDGKKENASTLASAEADQKKTPDAEQAQKNRDPSTTADNSQPDPAVADSSAAAEQPPPYESPLTPAPPPSEKKAGLSKGMVVVGGFAVLGAGAGAAYLIFKGDKSSNNDDDDIIPKRSPSSTDTKTKTVTTINTGTKTDTGTKISTGTKTNTSTTTSTNTGPISSVPYTGTLTATDVGTDTNSSTATETQSGTETATETSTNTSTSTGTRE